MVCFVPIVCLSIRKSCQRRDCSELGNVRNWVEHCICEKTDKTFDDVFNVNLKCAVIFPSRLRLKDILNTYGNQNWSIYSDIMTFVVKTLVP